MPNLITVKVDVSKLDKARFFRGKPDAAGHSPIYCDLVLIPRREIGRYGDTHLVKQSKKKDEEVDLPILGSATERGVEGRGATETRTFGREEINRDAPKPRPAPAPQHGINDDSSDIPF